MAITITSLDTNKNYSIDGMKLSNFSTTTGNYITFNDATETTFMNSLYQAYLEYCDKEATLRHIGEPDYSGHRKVRLSLLSGLIHAITFYFRERDNSDENWCTPAEIWDCIQHCNNIMDTTLYIDLSDY